MESKPKKVVSSEGRRMIYNVYHFLKREYEITLSNQESNCDLSHLENIIQRTAEATGVTEQTVHRILKEGYDGPSTSPSEDQPPMKTRRKEHYLVDVDEVMTAVVRSTIQEFHVVLKEIPTLAKLRSVLQDKIGFDGCLETLRTLLRKMGYHLRRTNNNKKVLVERHDIQMWRLKYLKKITEYRSQGRPIVYTDSRYILRTDDQNNIKNDQKDKQFSRSSLGTRFAVAHAGSEAGFIDNACLVYRTNIEFFGNYVKWLNEKLLPNLPDSSVVVLDSHHNVPAETMPTSVSKLSVMKLWLTAKGIQFDSNLRKVELYEIIKKHKNRFRTWQIDDYMKSKGFEVLRLPPYHSELNAIENIWKALKTYVAITYDKQNVEITKHILSKGIENITSNTWRNACNAVVMKEVEYMKYFDTELEFIIDLQDDNGDGTVSEDSSSDCD
ncbi:hypothetical protein PYW07_007934 [Mythimna separata]|uniref:Tc1-like transposase DDE domain-containing protein n=1 Tax=Mythimna separata TaxID=271217 RepID=A0AAD7YQF4_MYTSE|nr:hypothetical protein PYW07_007934 [Mythimna separata]